MKFLISEAEYETLPHESLEPVDFNGIVFEKVFEAKRRVRGLGEFITEDIRKQVHVIMKPVLENEEDGMYTVSGLSITGAKLLYELKEGINLALIQLQALSGIGKFDLWIKGRRYGDYTALGVDEEMVEDLFQIIDLEIGLSQEEWFDR